MRLRIASSNVENLFRRARIINAADNAGSTAVFADLDELRERIEETPNRVGVGPLAPSQTWTCGFPDGRFAPWWEVVWMKF